MTTVFFGQHKWGDMRTSIAAIVILAMFLSASCSTDESEQLVSGDGIQETHRLGEAHDFDGIEFVWIPPGEFELPPLSV